MTSEKPASPPAEGWTASDIGHAALDVAGLVPLIGEGADLANAAWYAAEGEYLDAGLSIISMVPGVGDVVGKGGRILKNVGGKAAKEALELLKKADFEKVLGPLRKHPKLGPYIDKIKKALDEWREKLTKEADNAAPGCTNCDGDGLAINRDLPKHLAGPDGFKGGRLHGTHNLENALAALTGKDPNFVHGLTELAPGIKKLEYVYTNPNTGKLVYGSKTVYDPAHYSDKFILEKANDAAQSGWKEFLKDPSMTSVDVLEDGINFRVYFNKDPAGNPIVGNVHPI